MKGFFALSGGESELKGAPEIVKLLPLGHVSTKKGDFEVDEESFKAMKAQMQQHGVDIVIDYEHQTLKDIQAPAGGWIKELVLQDGAIAAKVEWTETARQYLKNKEYRYISPVVFVNKDNRATMLHSAALTNTPAIDGMFPIINSLGLEDYGDSDNKEGGNNTMNELLKKIAALLGLGEEATEEEVMQKLGEALNEAKQRGDAAGQKQPPEEEGKIVANKVVCGLLGLEAGAKTDDVAAAIMALKQPKGFVPETELRALKEKIERKEADDAVLVALKAGKIAAAQKEWATEYALKDPNGFKAFVEKAPQVVPMGELGVEPDGRKAPQQTSEETLKICKMLGVSEEDLKKYGFGKDDK